MSQHFFAMMHRMRYITRWGLMRNTESENIEEHSLQVAILAHALAVIRRTRFAEGRLNPDPADVALLAIFHDASEILTGDLPTPVKYFNPEIQIAYKNVEAVATGKLLSMLPPELQPAYTPLLEPDRQDPVVDEAMSLVKAADRLSAFIKCLDEEKAGNQEFTQARLTIEASLDQIELPELAWFRANCLPSFRLTLDALNQPDFADRPENNDRKPEDVRERTNRNPAGAAGQTPRKPEALI